MRMNFEEDIFEILKKTTVNCLSSSTKFTNTERIEAIAELLKEGPYKLIHDGKLAKIYSKKDCDKKIKIISTHIDCVKYKEFFARKIENDMYEGIFDNAMTNAIIVKAMRDDVLGSNVLVAFTGDEERNSRGVDEVVKFVKDEGYEVKLTIAADTTFENFMPESLTLENFSPNTVEFESIVEKYANIVRTICTNVKVVNSDDADPDEFCQYDEHDFRAFTLCIPTYNKEVEMLSEDSLKVHKLNTRCYYEAIKLLTTIKVESIIYIVGIKIF